MIVIINRIKEVTGAHSKIYALTEQIFIFKVNPVLQYEW